MKELVTIFLIGIAIMMNVGNIICIVGNIYNLKENVNERFKKNSNRRLKWTAS